MAFTVDASEIGYGRVHYVVNALIGDSDDPDEIPEEVGVSGTWTISPLIDRIYVDGDDPYTMLPLRVTGVFVAGDLEYRSQPGVWLLAPPRNVNGTPKFLYQFEADYRYMGMSFKDSFKFDLPAGDPEDEDYTGVDLTLAKIGM